MVQARDFNGFAAPGPTVSDLTAPFWQAAAQGRFDLQRCADCDGWIFYPRAICPHCWSRRLAWHRASGRARLATWSVQVRPGHGAWAALAPYAVGLVTLEEGPRMMTTLLAPPEALAADLPLVVRFVPVGEWTLPMFEPA